MKALSKNMSAEDKRKTGNLLFSGKTDPAVALQDDINSIHTPERIKAAVGFQSCQESSHTDLSDVAVV
jgi:hypothetical protein